MKSNDLAWTVEEACQNAWPSPRQVLLDGWLLRASGGETRRTNSVNPLRNGPRDPTSIVGAAEDIYRSLGRPTYFRVPSIVPEMDQPLDRRGYVAEAETCTLFSNLDSYQPVAHKNVEISGDPSEEWFAAIAVQSNLTETIYRTMHRSIVLPKVYASRRVEEKLVAVAYGVVHHRILVVESVVTHQDYRRRGYGRQTVGTLLSWAKGSGAVGACLQVVAENEPACALYRSLGFNVELYRYHYRRRN